MTANEWMVLLVFALHRVGMFCAGGFFLGMFFLIVLSVAVFVTAGEKEQDSCWAFCKKAAIPVMLLVFLGGIGSCATPDREHVKYAACYFIAKQGVESFAESTVGKALMERASEEIKNFGKEEKK